MKKVITVFILNLMLLMTASVCLSLTPEEIIRLKKQGVSDKVILKMLQNEGRTGSSKGKVEGSIGRKEHALDLLRSCLDEDAELTTTSITIRKPGISAYDGIKLLDSYYIKSVEISFSQIESIDLGTFLWQVEAKAYCGRSYASIINFDGIGGSVRVHSLTLSLQNRDCIEQVTEAFEILCPDAKIKN